MKNFALGTKKQMLSFFTSDGVVIPATVIETKPLKIVELRTEEKNGYNAIVAGLGSHRKEFKMSVDNLTFDFSSFINHSLPKQCRIIRLLRRNPLPAIFLD